MELNNRKMTNNPPSSDIVIFKRYGKSTMKLNLQKMEWTSTKLKKKKIIRHPAATHNKLYRANTSVKLTTAQSIS